jgi:hypothetical protein
MLVFFHNMIFPKNKCCYFYLSYLVSPSNGCKSQLFFNFSVSGNRISVENLSLLCDPASGDTRSTRITGPVKKALE